MYLAGRLVAFRGVMELLVSLDVVELAHRAGDRTLVLRREAAVRNRARGALIPADRKLLVAHRRSLRRDSLQHVKRRQAREEFLHCCDDLALRSLGQVESDSDAHDAIDDGVEVVRGGHIQLECFTRCVEA